MLKFFLPRSSLGAQMSVRIGEPIGECKCGCGGILYEKIYDYPGRWSRTIVHRPTMLVGHSRPPANWSQRKNMVECAPVWKLLTRFKNEHKFTWIQLSEMIGFTYNVYDIKRNKYISRQNAERILRSIRDYHIANSR